MRVLVRLVVVLMLFRVSVPGLWLAAPGLSLVQLGLSSLSGPSLFALALQWLLPVFLLDPGTPLFLPLPLAPPSVLFA